jgi:hypothetical protein
MEITLVTTINRTAKVLERIGRNADFAAARALTEAAGFVRTVEREHLGDNMKIRTTWLRTSLVTRSATKDRLVSVVGVRRGQRGLDLAPELILGGEKAPYHNQQGIPKMGAGARGFDMPRGADNERKTLKGSNWPARLLDMLARTASLRKEGKSRNMKRTKAFKGGLVFLKDAKIPTIAVRVGPKEYKPLWFLYKDAVTIPKKWPFFERGSQTAQDALPVLTKLYMGQYIQQVRV